MGNYTLVDIQDAEFVEFIGFVDAFEHSAFKVLDKNGNDLEYVCEFAPHDLRNVRVVPCYTKTAVEEISEGKIPTEPIGLITNVRIVATLLVLAYPKGISQPVADFKGIESAVNGRKRIKLLGDDESEQVVSYAPFNQEWLDSRLK